MTTNIFSLPRLETLHVLEEWETEPNRQGIDLKRCVLANHDCTEMFELYYGGDDMGYGLTICDLERRNTYDSANTQDWGYLDRLFNGRDNWQQLITYMENTTPSRHAA